MAIFDFATASSSKAFMLMTPHGASLEKSCTVPWAVFVGKSPGSVGNVFQDWVANMTTAGKILMFGGVECLGESL